MKKIKVKNYFVLIDDIDYRFLIDHNISLSLQKRKYSIYIHCYFKGKHILLHRLIMKPRNDMDIDHINGNGLDNRRKNLRICTKKQNQGNRRKIGTFTSKYKGVYFPKGKKRWRANITKGTGTRFHLGYFDNEEDAAKAYDNAALEYFGKFANINFKQTLK